MDANFDGAMLGAQYLDQNRTRFLVWAPAAERVALHVLGPRERTTPMARLPGGYFGLMAEDVSPDTRYLYRLNDRTERPDPASRFQPDGVHGPSAVVQPAFGWEDDAWQGLPLADYVIYELHVGTFTPAGAFTAAIAELDELKRLGITAIELMPVGQFPGGRNWGYDGAYPFAVQNTYGGPHGLKTLINACHTRGLAVVLDVVYNHLGPEGNYLAEFGPYFTNRYHTPWGPALNFDGPGSDDVRRYFIENALTWIGEFHVDALRLDATHAIFDSLATPFLADLAAAVDAARRAVGRHVHLIAESNKNDPRLVQSVEAGGLGIDAVLLDDFQHALHTLLTGERIGYYCDFGRLEDLAKAYADGFVLTGKHSDHRGRRHGASSRHVPPERLVAYAQNHDTIGNRPRGDRPGRYATFEDQKLAAAALLLAPYVPLIFMGEEYGELAPFFFFTSYGDSRAIEGVRNGRRAEFKLEGWDEVPPDPQDGATFERCRLNHSLRHRGHHAVLWAMHQELLRLRRDLPPLVRGSRKDSQTIVATQGELILSLRSAERVSVCVGLYFGHQPLEWSPGEAGMTGSWTLRFDSADASWAGPGSGIPKHASLETDRLLMAPRSAVLLIRSDGSEAASA